MDEIKAKKAYEQTCKILDGIGWHYTRHDEKCLIESNIKGDDLPIRFLITFNPNLDIMSYMSFMPFDVPEGKRADMAIALTTINFGLADGSFDMNMEDGTVLFRLTTSFKNIDISEDLIQYVIHLSSSTVDRYNDHLFGLSMGMLSLADFIEWKENK